MDSELKNKLDILEKKIDNVERYSKTIKNVFLWTFIITIIAVVFPLIGMLFILPKFMSSFDVSGYSQLLGI